jgi:hypothetical protein
MHTSVSQKDLKTLFNQLKASAKKRNISFQLTPNDLNELTFPITCPVLGITLRFNRGAPKDDSYSIDRIDSTMGYEPDNIVVVSNRVNILKRDASLDELKKIVEFYS